MFSQKACAFGASGRMAPTPTIATARCTAFSMTFSSRAVRHLMTRRGELPDACARFLTVESQFCQFFCWTLLCASVQHVGDVVHVSQQANLRTPDCRQSQGEFECGQRSLWPRRPECYGPY